MSEAIIMKAIALGGVWLCVAVSMATKNVTGQGAFMILIIALVMTGLLA